MTTDAKYGMTWQRSASFAAKIDDSKRTVEVSFSSERKVERSFGFEILDHSPASVNLDRLNANGAVLLEHDPEKHVGVVVKAWLDTSKRQCKAIVRLGNSELANCVWQDIKDGILCNLSCSYVAGDKRDEGNRTFRFYDWEPLEISFVTIPADTSVGVGRSVNVNDLHSTITASRSEQISTEQKFMNRIEYTEKPEYGPLIVPEKTLRAYSFQKHVRETVDGRVTGAEAEVEQGTRSHYKGLTIHGIPVPSEIFGRALNVTTLTSGGALAGQQMAPTIELLRNMPICERLGATVINASGEIAIPRFTAGATASGGLTESAQATLADASFGQLRLTPKRISAGMAYQRELFFNASEDIENLLRREIATALAVKQDALCIGGVGGAAEPVGILQTTGVGSVTFGAAATWAKILTFIKTGKTSNAFVRPLAWAISPATEEKFRGAQRWTGASVALMTDDDRIGGYHAEVTNQLPSGDKCIYGAWEELVICIFYGLLDVVVDPFTSKKAAQIELLCTRWFDSGLRHSASMTVSSDSAAQ